MEGSLITPMAEMHLETTLEHPSHPPLIFGLPRELLVYILELVQKSEWYPWLYAETRESRWLRFSLVCRAWRIVILDSPSLWRYIEFTSLRWTRVMFERSGDMSIDVRYPTVQQDQLDQVHSDNVANMHMILDNIHRTRQLILSGVAVRLLFRYADASLAAPLLKSLCLDAFDLDPTWRACIRNIPFSCVDQLYDLRLFDINVRLPSSCFQPNLTRLVLLKQTTHTGGYTITQIMNILKRMPVLKYLSLVSSVADSSGDDSNMESILPSPVVLPQLKVLEFTGETLLQCAIFVRHLSLPQTTYIRLRSAREDPGETIFPSSYLPQQRLGGLDPLPLRILSVHYNSISIDIHAFPSAIDKRSGALWLGVRIPPDLWERPEVEMGIARLLDPLDLKFVTSLTLSTSESVDWSPVLPVVHGVENIKVRHDSWQSFASSLLVHISLDAENDLTPGARMLCPCLRRLEFDDHHETGTVDMAFFEVLATVLDERQESGLLVEVIIQGEPLTAKELRNLEEMKRKEVWKLDDFPRP